MINEIYKRLKTIPNRRDIHILLDEFKFKIFCEIGVRIGENLLDMLKANPTEMVAVDLWREDGVRTRNDLSYSQKELDSQFQYIQSLQVQYPAIKIIRNYSTEAAKQFADGYFDYVYIDADHTYEAVRDDIKAWYPKVRQYGILGGHDYHPNAPTCTVNMAVDEFVRQNSLLFHSEISNSWYVVKP